MHFPGLLQDFSRSKLRFSRTVICSIKCCIGLYYHLFLQEKYSNYNFVCIFKTSQDFSRTFSCFPFSPGLFQAWEFFSFPRFSRFSRCVGILYKEIQHIIDHKTLPFLRNNTYRQRGFLSCQMYCLCF